MFAGSAKAGPNKYTYLSHPLLKRANVQVPFTQEQAQEIARCINDPVYFTIKYVKIITIDQGLVPFNLWDFQKKMMNTFYKNRFVVCKLPRQVGKSTTVIAYILHQIIFREQTKVAILANKGETARELLSRLQLAYENLPLWLQQGVVVWNKGSIELDNGSKVLAASTSSSAIRGQTFNILLLDEFAHVPNNQAEFFFNSVYPTITSGKTSQVIIVSTPLGLNHFYKIWKDAEEGRSHYKNVSVHWSQVPGRDQKWKEETIKNTSERQFEQEFECNFLGSSNTLISASKLQTMVWRLPIKSENGLDIYELPEPGHTYALTVDVSRGQGQDYHAFSVIDVTFVPYKQVAKYRSNDIPAMLYPTNIYSTARLYNDAYVLVEVSDIGGQVADILHFELEYENLVKITIKGKLGQQVSAGHTKKIQFGLKQSTATKRIGCANLKTLVENDKLILYDADTIQELYHFISDKQSFSADQGSHDDLVMSLVLFGWYSAQRHFKEALTRDIRKVLQQEQMHIMEDDAVPFGFSNDGTEEEVEIDDATGDIWISDRMRKYPFDSYSDWDYNGKIMKL